jgi:shikimate dehydrogenase
MPPVPRTAVGPHTICYDLAYSKAATPFVKWAKAAGCAKALQGVGMLVEQAAESFFLWRGVRPATAHVLTVLRERTGG